MRAQCARHRRERSLHQPKETVMANTLGNFTKLDTGAFTGTFKTLNVNASLSIVPVDKMSEDAPDHRVYAGPAQRYEVGAGWSQVAKSRARNTSTSRSRHRNSGRTRSTAVS